MLRLYLYARVQLLLCANSTRDLGCSEHPVFPAPSEFEEGKEDANLGQTCREIAKSHSVVITRESGRSSRPEAVLIEPRSRGVLDPRLRGDDGLQ